MSKRKRAGKAATPSAQLRRAELEAVSGVERVKPAAAPGKPPKKGRAGSRGVVVYLNPTAKDVLDQLSLQKKKSLQKLGIEAFNHLFRAYGQKPIA